MLGVIYDMEFDSIMLVLFVMINVIVNIDDRFKGCWNEEEYYGINRLYCFV